MSKISDAARKAYEAGRQARVNLEPITACPYKHSDYGLGYEWDMGWRRQDKAAQHLQRIGRYICPKCHKTHNHFWFAVQCCIAPQQG